MSFITDDFMLHSDAARKLYHGYAEGLPIVDYHCHLPPQELAEDRRFRSITELMLGGDHYKWRYMRSAGITEDYITGNRSDEEKFLAWAKVLSLAIGNPLYHWTHLELKRYFGVEEPLNEKNAQKIYELCSDKLQKPEYSARGLVKMSNVRVICTTDDPADDLHWHGIIADAGLSTGVFPAFRPDKALNITAPDFAAYIQKTGAKNYAELVRWMAARVDFFHQKGSRLSDHSLSHVTYARGNAASVLEKRLNGGEITALEESIYRTELLLELGRLYASHGWTMQLHLGATRNNNTRMFRSLGPDAGFDGVGDESMAYPLAALLDALDVDNSLPKTILYTLNQKDYTMLGAMLGNFQDGSSFGKIQLGSGWWFCDTRDGMEGQLKALGNLGCLASFVGMLTDSRSFVSYPRHEYFRRILCNLLGEWVEKGEYPADWETLGKIVRGISYENAVNYFSFPGVTL